MPGFASGPVRQNLYILYVMLARTSRQGTETIITDRSLLIARLLRLDTTAAIERLTAEGVIAVVPVSL